MKAMNQKLQFSLNRHYSKAHGVGNGEDRKYETEEANITYNLYHQYFVSFTSLLGITV
jgi:hypothetical protein